MQLSHSPGETSAVFEDPNLVSCAGLVPMVALAQRCGLAELVSSKLTLPARGGANAHLGAGDKPHPGFTGRWATSRPGAWCNPLGVGVTASPSAAGTPSSGLG